MTESENGSKMVRKFQKLLELLHRLELAAAELNQRVVLADLRPQEWIDKQDRRFEKFKKEIFFMIWNNDLENACKALSDFDFDGERLEANEMFRLLLRPLRDFIGVLANEDQAPSPFKDKVETASGPQE